MKHCLKQSIPLPETEHVRFSGTSLSATLKLPSFEREDEDNSHLTSCLVPQTSESFDINIHIFNKGLFFLSQATEKPPCDFTHVLLQRYHIYFALRVLPNRRVQIYPAFIKENIFSLALPHLNRPEPWDILQLEENQGSNKL